MTTDTARAERITAEIRKTEERLSLLSRHRMHDAAAMTFLTLLTLKSELRDA